MSSHERPHLSRSALRTPIRFLFAGGSAAAVNFASRVILSKWLPYPTSVVVAFCFGMTTAFVLNRRFVFAQATSRLHGQIFWFVTINLIALVQTVAVSLLLADVVLPGIGVSSHKEELSHAAGIAVPILTSYLGHKRLTFR